MSEDKGYWAKINQARTQALFDLQSNQDLLMRQIV